MQRDFREPRSRRADPRHQVLSGIATGLSSVVAPMYISESAPKQIRGSLAVCFNLIILVSLTIAFWINYAVSNWTDISDAQWRVPMGVQMAPGGCCYSSGCSSNLRARGT